MLVVFTFHNFGFFFIDIYVYFSCFFRFDYVKYVKRIYKGDPVMFSRMMLIILKLIKLLDEHLITNTCKMLENHHSGIDSNIINTLLLPERVDMDLAYELEQYFRDRNDYATDPALLEDVIKERSFSVKYAKKNQQMCQLRKQILQLDEENVADMETKHTNGRNWAETLRDEANKIDCFYKINYYGKQRHIKKRCRRCSLRSQASAIRYEEYEHLLPTKEYEQFGVVFELRVPKEIALLRDVLYEFNRICVTDPPKLNIRGDWTTRREMSQFSVHSSNRFVTFGSTTRRQHANYHVDESFDTFIIPNSYNCTYHVNNFAISTSLKDAVARKILTFKMQDEYECLQWTVDGALHTQNQVFARQSECPQNDLSLSEFKNFGSLRADGHRLQLRKLFAMIETEALSFDKESVLLLIMQTLWECGVSGAGESLREPHMDLNEPKFCTALIELLEHFIGKHKHNWMNPFKLLVATVIAVRAFEINGTETLANEIVQRLLKRIRHIAVDWIDKINDVINGNQDLQGSDENKLRLKLMYAAIIGAITFCIQPGHEYFKYIVKNADNSDIKTWITPQFWLHFIITLNVNTNLYGNNEDRTPKLPSTLCVFKRLIEIGGIHLESTMHELIEQNHSKVYQTIAKHWSSAKNAGHRLSIYFDSDCPQLLIIDVWVQDNLNIFIEVDIIIGEFLINGLPLSRLPSEMTKNEMYKMFFGKASLAVQTNLQNHFSTVYNNINYEFRTGDQGLIITERRSDDFVRETVFYEIFRDDFPDSLVRYYQHWWNKRDNCIDFQKNHLYIGHPNYSPDADIDYRLDLNTRHLVHVQSNRRMLDIGSDSFRKIANHLARLEHPIYIHVLLEEPKVAIVELFRMKLKFKLDCSNRAELQPSQGFRLQSFEFNGMCVSLNQKIGTLYGLNHGLVLESLDQSKPKILLIPHGSVVVQCVDESVSASIDFFDTNIRNPPIYQYQVDECLKQLKASDSSYSAWFYLAYLHAVTSHGEPEPLTGMSGTERALQILQSAFAWSSSPYEPQALNLLHDIAALSPCRKKINFHQIIEWPTHVPHHSAQDSFIFMVKKLIEDSQRLYGLHSTTPMQKFQIKTDLALNQRDYLRCLQLHPNLRISDAFIEHKISKTSLPKVQTIAFSKNAQMISILYHNQKYHIPTATNLKEFLTKGKELQGIRSVECISNILNHIQYEKLVDLWIRLYDVARDREQLNHEEFALALSLFAHQNAEIAPILALQAIAQNPQAFESINPPSVQTFRTANGSFDQAKVSNLLETYYPKCQLDPFNLNSLRYGLGLLGVSDTADENTTRNEIIRSLTAKISRCWPCNSVNLSEMCTYEKINEHFQSSIYRINAELNSMLSFWYDNYRLNEFIDKIETRLKSLAQSSFNPLSIPQFRPFVEPTAKNLQTYAINVDKLVHGTFNDFKDVICEAKSVWQMDEESVKVRVRSSNEWWTLIENMFITEKTEHLFYAGLIERMVPSLFLRKILNADTNADLKALIGAWATAIAREQYQKRAGIRSGNSDLAAARESENRPHMNWKPCEYPEWLLFEIEQNLTIRRIQIEIAKRMISPPPNADGCSTKHSVMQLNMGEGKTAVIVPILAAVLANGNEACQITVLKSLFARNLKFLRQYLGGLLNRRVYIFPCRRDMHIHRYIEEILGLHEECKVEMGKILFDHKCERSSENS